MRILIKLLFFILVSLSAKSQTLRPGGFPTTNSPSRFDITGYQQDSAFLYILRDSFPAKYPSVIYHTNGNLYKSPGGIGAHWSLITDTSFLSARINLKLNISDTSNMLNHYHEAFYAAVFDTSARILTLYPITGSSPVNVSIPRGGAVNGITDLTPLRNSGSNVQFILADNGDLTGFSLNTTDSLTKIHVADTAAMLSGSVRTVGIVSANGVSGSSSGGQSPLLTISLGAITPSSVSSGGPITGTSLAGTLVTPAQPNITSIGTLSILTVNNSITTGTVYSAILNGTIGTPSQPNITTVGTLSALTVTEGITASNFNGSGRALSGVVTTVSAGTGISVSSSGGVFTVTNTSPSSGGTLTSISKTDQYGFSSTISLPTTTPIIRGQVDTSLIVPYTDTLKVNGVATKTDIFNQLISLPFVTVEEYGTVDAAVATGKSVYLKGNNTYNITTTKTLATGQSIFSNGNANVTFAGITAIVPGQSSHIEGIRFIGSKSTTNSPNEYAIKMHANPYNMVTNCEFVDISTAAVLYDSTTISNIIAENRFYNCKVAIKAGAGGEYGILANNRMQLCDTGYSIIGGNNSINGGNATDGGVGLYIGSDLVNEGHFTVGNFTSNHNTYDLYVENIGIKNAVLLNSCAFQVGNILVKNSSNIQISSSILDILGNSFTNDNSSVKVLFNSWRSAPSYSEINGGTHVFRDNQLNYTSPTTADSITWMSLGTLASSDFKGQGSTGTLLQGAGGTGNNPSWVSSINLSGTISASALTISGNASVGGNLTVTGSQSIGSNLTVTGNVTASSFSGSGTALTGVVNTIGVTTANGVSASSSGGQNPRLTVTLGAITPSTVVASSTIQGTAGTLTQNVNGAASLTFTNYGSIITRSSGVSNIPLGLQYSTLGNNHLSLLASSNAGTAGYGVNVIAYNSAVYYRGLTYNNVSIAAPVLRLQQDGGTTDIGSSAGDSIRMRWLPTGKQLKQVYIDASGYLYQADSTANTSSTNYWKDSSGYLAPATGYGGRNIFTTGTVQATSVSTTGSVTAQHLGGNSGIPTISAINGTATLLTGSNDIAGRISWIPSSTGVSSAAITLTFNTSYGRTPFFSLTPGSGASAAVLYNVDNATSDATKLVIGFNNATYVNGTTYIIYYQVIQ